MVKFSDTDDIIVMALVVIISYILAYVVSRAGSANLRREVDDLLNDDIYDEEYLALLVKKERLLKRKRLILMSSLAILGIILLSLIILLNYTS